VSATRVETYSNWNTNRLTLIERDMPAIINKQFIKCKYLLLAATAFGILLACVSCYSPTIATQPELKGTVFQPDGKTPVKNCLVVFSAYKVETPGWTSGGAVVKLLEETYSFSDTNGHFVLSRFSVLSVKGGPRGVHPQIGFEAACANGFIDKGPFIDRIDMSNHNDIRIILKKVDAKESCGRLFEYVNNGRNSSNTKFINAVSFRREDYPKILTLLTDIETGVKEEDPTFYKLNDLLQQEFHELENKYK
jgi:hypothetical protein